MDQRRLDHRRWEEWERLADYRERRDQQEDHTLPFPLPWTEHLRILLCGVRDPESALSTLQGHEDTVLRQIYEQVLGSWKASVKPVPPANTVTYEYGSPVAKAGTSDIAFCICASHVRFPDPADRNVNMMPFIMGDPKSLPVELRIYYDLLVRRCPVSDSEFGKVCYLTVMESYVEAGQTQRRGGLHVEAAGSHGRLKQLHRWGGGFNRYEGGFFLASNVARTTEVFEDVVDHSYGTVDKHGGVEHLRPYLGEGFLVEADELIWLTDRTPHEALPQATSGNRQFFRLVTSNISHWYEEHSTPNPKVPLPGSVIVVKGSRFK